MHNDQPPEKRAERAPSRRPYRKPDLVTYGPLAKLTRSNQSGTGEAAPTGAMRMCL